MVFSQDSNKKMNYNLILFTQLRSFSDLTISLSLS